MSVLVAFLLCAVVAVQSVVIDSPEAHSWDWFKRSRTDPSKGINLMFAVKQRNLDVLHRTLMEVSTPSHARYGQHLSSWDVHDLVRPSRESSSAVMAWLLSSGFKADEIEKATPNGDFLRVSTSIGQAEELLSTRYFDYEHKVRGRTISRVDWDLDYEVPASVAVHLDFVAPTKRMPSPMNVTVVEDHSPLAAVTPSFLRGLYQLGTHVGSAPSNVQGIASFLEQYYSTADLNTFWKDFSIPTATVTRVPSSQPDGHGIEAELDVQYVTAMGEKIATQVWYTSGRAPNNKANEPFLQWLTDVESATNPPKIFSVSYGEDEKSVGLNYGGRVNAEFMKIGTMGISVLVASGDSGAGGNCSRSGDRETPDFPAGSPYITAVGGTHGGTAGRSPTGEVAWTGSGGGFSDYWPQPTWQTTAVANYFATATALPPTSKYNRSGRGYPDVAAQSVDFEIVYRGKTTGVSGTSCASPTAGGIFSLLNDLRLQNNMAPLGFLNPFLYATAGKDGTALNDITSGHNSGCGGLGFPTNKAWDAVTGWGTPNYAKLATYVLQTGRKTQKQAPKRKIQLKEDAVQKLFQ